jgi:hypothetical protein
VDQNVVQGNSAPDQFTWNGQNYNIVGSISITLSYNSTPNWMILLPLGLSETIPMGMLADVMWPNLLKPLVDGVVNMAKWCYRNAAQICGQAEVDDAAAQAAQNAEVDEAEVAEDTVSMEASCAAASLFVVLLAVPFIVAALSHPSYQTLKVYNLTSYDLTWSLPTIPHGANNLAPSTGQGQTLDYLIPASENTAPPGITPVMSSHEADFSFVSQSGFTGIGYVLGFSLTDPANGNQLVTQGNVLFSIPWSGENSLAAAMTNEDPKSWWDANNGTQSTTQAAASGAGVTVTATFDFLSGKHPAPNGQETYTYNSLLVFQTPG